MEVLSATDLHTVLDVARELGSVRDLDGLYAGVLPQLRRLVPYDTASFNEIAPSAGEAIVTVVEPAETLYEGAEEVFGAFAHQNPLIAAAQRQGPAQVLKFSDLITRRQLHSLDIYDLIYSRIGVEHQIACTLPAPSAHVVGFALNRKHRDFSERDRGVLEAIQPFVIQAYATAAASAHARGMIAALERTAGAGDQAVVLVGRGGRVELATELARGWLDELAAGQARLRLPEPFGAWAATQQRRSREGLCVGERLHVPTPDGTLTAQFIPGATGRLDAILLQQRAPLRVRTLRALGLTEREIEVLQLLAIGLSNGQIASELVISERTVAKHLEHVYGKLGVGSRTAAIARAREAATHEQREQATAQRK